MSQDKVNRYKEEKANRQKLMAKEKRKNMIRKCSGIVIGIAVIGWLGFSVYNWVQTGLPREELVVDYSAIEGYMNDFTVSE